MEILFKINKFLQIIPNLITAQTSVKLHHTDNQ